MRSASLMLLILALGGLEHCCVAGPDSAGAPAEQASPAGGGAPPIAERRLYSGRVVRLRELLERKGLKFASEMQDHTVLETDDGRVLPILADWRGRAFYQDARLRDRPVTLVATFRPDIGYLQVLMVFLHDDQGGTLFTDYWCDVCSIPMYELKACECCQGEIRLRSEPQDLPSDVKPLLP